MKERREFLESMEQVLCQRRENIMALVAPEVRDDDDTARQVGDSADEAQNISIEKLKNSWQMTELDELRFIELAIDRIKKGEFGVCLDCGEQISQKRLEFQPLAARCITCQETAEG